MKKVDFEISFLVIGAMKSGTTTFNKIAGSHPDVFLLDDEPRFWYSDAKYQDGNGLGDYEDWFHRHGLGNEKIVGESSGYYSWVTRFPDLPNRLVRHFPHVKIVYLVRDPIDRLISHYRWELANGVPLGSLKKALRDRAYLLDMSLYETQLAKYLEVLPEQQIFVLQFERFIESPEEEIQRFWAWVGAGSHQVTSIDQFHENQTEGRMRDSMALQYGKTILKRLHLLKFSRSLFGGRLSNLLKTKRSLEVSPEQLAGFQELDPLRVEAREFARKWDLDTTLWKSSCPA